MMEKTAGMVQGTPDWQLDRMWETESAKIWEALNAEPVSATQKLDGKKRRIACGMIEMMLHMDMAPALEWIAQAYNEVENTPAGDRLAMIYDRMSDIKTDLRCIAAEIKGSGF